MRHVFWLDILWNLGIFRAIADLRTVASIEYLDTIAKVSDVFGGFCFELFVVEFDIWILPTDVGFDIFAVFGLSDNAR